MTERQTRFETLLDQHAGIVVKVARAYTRSVDDRHDLEQEIATQLWRAFDRYDARLGKFSTWLYRIALNVAISSLRRARTFEPLDDEPAAAPVVPDDRLDALYAQLRGFPPLDRALVLLYFEDRSYAEIADVLGISEANVATKLSRIKAKLREQLKGHAS